MVFTAPGVEGLSAQYLRGWIHLTVLYVAPVTGSEDGHFVGSGGLTEVMVDISRIIEIISHYYVRMLACGECREEQSRCGTAQARQQNAPGFTVIDKSRKRLNARRRSKKSVSFQ